MAHLYLRFQVRFPCVTIKELTNVLSAPQWEILKVSSKFKAFEKQATKVSMATLFLFLFIFVNSVLLFFDLVIRHLKREHQASDIPALKASTIFGGLISSMIKKYGSN